MALDANFRFESLDSTEFLNRRLQSLVTKGVYSGGLLSVQAGTLTAVRSAFLAVGYDGLTVFDLQAATATFTAGQTSYHVVLAKYNPLGTPATPTLQELVLSESAFNSHADKAYLITLAKVVVPAGATELLDSYIDYTVRDAVDPVSRNIVRGSVASVAALPSGSPASNRVNDLYVTQTENSIYRWSGSAWVRIVADGAATLDGAYDNAGGTPGSGRLVTADAGAIEVTQSVTSQRGADVGNAALRIRKVGTTVDGDGAIDVAITDGQDSSPGGASAHALLVRERLVQGTDINADEAATLSSGSGGPLSLTRVGVDLQAILWGGAGFLVHLVEITGSTKGQDGVYLFDVTGTSAGTIKSLDGSAVSCTSETGLTANVYVLRLATGGVVDNTLVSDLSVQTSAFELLGQIGEAVGAGKVGKIQAFTDGSIADVSRVYKLASGAVPELLSYLDPEGILYSKNGLFGGYSSASAILTATNSGSGAGLSGQSTTGPGVYGYGLPGVYGENVGTTKANATVVGNALATAGYGVYAHLSNVGAKTGTAIYADSRSAGVGDDSGAKAIHGVTFDGVAVKGEADGTGIGVEGTSFAFDSNQQITIRLPLTSGGALDTDWELRGLGPGDETYWYAKSGTLADLYFEYVVPRGCISVDVRMDADPGGIVAMSAAVERWAKADPTSAAASSLSVTLATLTTSGASRQNVGGGSGWKFGVSSTLVVKVRAGQAGDHLYGIYLILEIIDVNYFTGIQAP